jgi:DNA-directed RNA polymerase specialized sigma24 family protein
LDTRENPDFPQLAIRLAGYGLRTFAEFGLGGRSAAVPGLGLSIEDFVSRVLAEYVEGRLAYEASRGELFSLLAKALRNDIIDALRRAAHAHEDARAVAPRQGGSDGQPPSLDEFPVAGADISVSLDDERYKENVRARFRDEPELSEIVRAVLDLDLEKPQEIAEALGISTEEYHNGKKRLRRRLVEYHLVEAGRNERRRLEESF